MEYIGWEKALIGTALSRPELMDQAIDLRPNDFTGCHQILWSMIIQLNASGTLEARTLIETLKERKTLDEIKSLEDPNIQGEAYIAELISCRGGVMNSYVDKVLGTSVRRELRTASGIIASYAQDENMTAQEALDKAEQRLLNVRRDRSSEKGLSMGMLMGMFSNRLDAMLSGTFVPAYVPSIQNIADVVMYAEEDEYLVVAGRPGDGKSSVARYEALKLAMNGKAPLIFNLENSEIEYARAFISMVTGIDNQLLKKPNGLSPEQHQLVLEKMDWLFNLPLEVVSLGGPSIKEIDRICRAKLTTLKPALIIIDYLQLVMNPGMDSQVANVTYTSQKTRAMAKNYKVPVMGLGQLNREIDKRGKNAEPFLSDLRDSGSLEQDATQVWFTRPIWDEPNENQLRIFPGNINPNGTVKSKPPVRPMRFYIKKNRNGPTGISDPVEWDMSTGRYRSLAMQTVDLNAA